MLRNIKSRASLFSNEDAYDRYVNSQRNNYEDTYNTQEINNEKITHKTLSDIDVLIKRYHFLLDELKMVKEQLNNLGVDPVN
jgi:hypothetical protein